METRLSNTSRFGATTSHGQGGSSVASPDIAFANVDLF